MDANLRTTLFLACHEAVLRFFAALDAGRINEVANSFAADGIWHRQGAALRGPDGVAKALAARPAGRITAHLVQNFIADFDDEATARAHYLVLTYRHDAPAASTAPGPMGIPYSIAEYDDRLCRREDGERWLVRERRSRNIFINA